MFYKYFYVFKNLKNVFLDQKFKENQEMKKDFKIESRRSSADFTIHRLPSAHLGPNLAFWALKRPFERPSAQFRSKFDILSFKTLFLCILSPHPIILTLYKVSKRNSTSPWLHFRIDWLIESVLAY